MGAGDWERAAYEEGGAWGQGAAARQRATVDPKTLTKWAWRGRQGSRFPSKLEQPWLFWWLYLSSDFPVDFYCFVSGARLPGLKPFFNHPSEHRLSFLLCLNLEMTTWGGSIRISWALGMGCDISALCWGSWFLWWWWGMRTISMNCLKKMKVIKCLIF